MDPHPGGAVGYDTPTAHGHEGDAPGVGLSNPGQAYGAPLHLPDSYLIHSVLEQPYPPNIPTRMPDDVRAANFGSHTEDESLWVGTMGQHTSEDGMRAGNMVPRPGEDIMRANSVAPRPGGEDMMRVGNMAPRPCDDIMRVGNVAPRSGDDMMRVGNMAPRPGEDIAMMRANSVILPCNSDENMRASALPPSHGEESMRPGNMNMGLRPGDEGVMADGHGGQRQSLLSQRNGGMLPGSHVGIQHNVPLHYYMEEGSSSVNNVPPQNALSGLHPHTDMSGMTLGSKVASLNIQGPHESMASGSGGRAGPSLPMPVTDMAHRHPPLTTTGDKTEGVEVERGDDGSLKSATKDYTERNLPRELMGKMFGLLKEGMFCDAVILAGNKEIRVHKMVLIAASPFLLSKLSKTTPSTSLRVELPSGIPLQVASQLIHYLYDGKVTLTTDNVSQFARVANLFKLEHLYNICEDFIDCFNLDESALNVLEEDISVSATEPRTSPVALKKRHLKLNAEENMAETEITDTAKSPNTSVQPSSLATPPSKTVCGKGKNSGKKFPKKSSKVKLEEVTAPVAETPVHRVSHLYGTRAASAAKVSKQTLDLDKGSADISEDSGAYKDGVDGVPGVMSSQVKSGLLYAESEKSLEEDEDTSEENDEDGQENIGTQTPQQQGKQTATKVQSAKKGRPKKTAIPPPPKPELPSRQPPKKRAREFAKSEEDRIFMDLGSKLDLYDLDAPLSQTIEKPAKKKAATTKPKRKRKRSVMSGGILKSELAALIAELDRNAENIPEGERQFKCKLCGNEFVFPKRSITHLVNTHDVSPNDVLSYITTRKFEKSPRICDICGYETKEPNFYYIHYHRYFRHGIPLPKGWKPYTCDICGKECFTKFQLKDHKLIHREQTPFICEKCGQGFKSRTCLNSHVFHRHNSVRKHDCANCDKSFKTKTQLMVHYRIHTGEKPFNCPDCDYKSTTRGNMRLHLTNKHKYDLQDIKSMMYQIKTLSKAYEISQDMITTGANAQPQQSDMLGVKNEMKAENQVGVHLSMDGDSHKHSQPAIQTVNREAVYANMSNIQLVTNPEGQTSQLIYTDENLTNRHIILQSYNNQPIVTGELQQGQTTGNIEGQEAQATTIPVLLQSVQGDQLSGGHFLVQTHHGSQGTVQLLGADEHNMANVPHNMAQETHILVQDSHGILQDSGQVLISEQDQMAISSGRRPGHEQHIVYMERPASDMVQQGQLIMSTADKNVVSVHDGHSTTELQNVSPRLMIDGRPHQGIHIQIHTAGDMESDSQGQVHEQHVRLHTQSLLGDEAAQVTLVRQALNVQEVKDNPKQNMMASSEPLESYQQVSLPVTSGIAQSTYVVNSQTTATTLEAQDSMGAQGSANPHGLPTSQSQVLPESSNTQTPHSYSDANLYQYYHQQFNNF